MGIRILSRAVSEQSTAEDSELLQIQWNVNLKMTAFIIILI